MGSFAPSHHLPVKSKPTSPSGWCRARLPAWHRPRSPPSRSLLQPLPKFSGVRQRATALTPCSAKSARFPAIFDRDTGRGAPLVQCRLFSSTSPLRIEAARLPTAQKFKFSQFHNFRAKFRLYFQYVIAHPATKRAGSCYQTGTPLLLNGRVPATKRAAQLRGQPHP